MEENIIQKIRYSASARIVVIGVLMLALLIPLQMVKGIIDERASLKDDAVAEISQKWGGRQVVAGPVLSVPYKTYSIDENNIRTEYIAYAHILPETLKIDGSIEPQKRSRGIFDAVVYSSELDLSGQFSNADIASLESKGIDPMWDKAFVSVGISDIRGVESSIILNLDGKEIPFKPGAPTNNVIRAQTKYVKSSSYQSDWGEEISYPEEFKGTDQNSGASADVAIVPDSKKEALDFSFTLNLKGSQSIQFVPVGKTTEVSLRSDWTNPSFSGAFLPDTREFTDKGFTASWKVLDINRGYPQTWLGSSYNIYLSTSGVDLLSGIDGYAKSERGAKYAILIIALTFLTFFFTEIFNKRKIHPVQYSLVGLSLVLFYALLVSLSEVIGFTAAYAASSVATIGLITLYAKSALANQRTAMTQGAVLAFLYVFIFMLLQLEDYALLTGSTLLFVILSAVMFISRKVDWYNIGKEK